MTDDEVWVVTWKDTGEVYGVYGTERRAWRAWWQLPVDLKRAHDGGVEIEPWVVQR